MRHHCCCCCCCCCCCYCCCNNRNGPSFSLSKWNLLIDKSILSSEEGTSSRNAIIVQKSHYKYEPPTHKIYKYIRAVLTSSSPTFLDVFFKSFLPSSASGCRYRWFVMMAGRSMLLHTSAGTNVFFFSSVVRFVRSTGPDTRISKHTFSTKHPSVTTLPARGAAASSSSYRYEPAAGKKNKRTDSFAAPTRNSIDFSDSTCDGQSIHPSNNQ
jgi:hypothetical protein